MNSTVDLEITDQNPSFCMGPIGPGNFTIMYDLSAGYGQVSLTLRNATRHFRHAAGGFDYLKMTQVVELTEPIYFWLVRYVLNPTVTVTGRIEPTPVIPVSCPTPATLPVMSCPPIPLTAPPVFCPTIPSCPVLPSCPTVSVICPEPTEEALYRDIVIIIVCVIAAESGIIGIRFLRHKCRARRHRSLPEASIPLKHV